MESAVAVSGPTGTMEIAGEHVADIAARSELVITDSANSDRVISDRGIVRPLHVRSHPVTHRNGSCGGVCPVLVATSIRAEALSRALDDADRIITDLRSRVAVLEQMAVTDELTGVLNRRGFMAQLQQTLAVNRRAIAAGEPPCGLLMLFDLNDFKAINDQYGHLAGDQVLSAVADALMRQVRIEDAVARLGGDEFALLLVGMPHDSGDSRAGQLAASVDGLAVQLKEGPKVVIGVASGWAVIRGDDNEASLLARADEALYQKKPLQKARWNRGKR